MYKVFINICIGVIFQLPNIPGGDLHGVCCPHKEDSGGLQRVQVHRVQHVRKLVLFISFKSCNESKLIEFSMYN